MAIRLGIARAMGYTGGAAGLLDPMSLKRGPLFPSTMPCASSSNRSPSAMG